MLSSHPQLQVIEGPFQNAQMLGPEKLLRRRMAEDANPPAVIEANRDETYQKAFDRLQEAIIVAAEKVSDLIGAYLMC